MSGHLLLITLGPVQEFIAQARRTRDLWYGSHILSELARCAARTLVAGNARLIFPALDKGNTELQACPAPLREDSKPPLAIANKLLAEVPAPIDPKEMARKVREEVQRFWRDTVARPVRDRCRGILGEEVDEAWDEQIGTILEFAAAWAPLDNYKNARAAVNEAVAARKNLRDFDAWKHLQCGVRMSSLDGARETVLREKDRAKQVAAKYRISDGEQLDAVGLVKRAGGDPEQFVPIVNVALASWIAFAEENEGDRVESLRSACRDLRVPRVQRDIVRAFPFDATVVLPSRW